MPVDLRPAKAELRNQILSQRNALSSAEVDAAGEHMARYVCALPIFASAATLAGYMAIGAEAPTREILQAALAAGKRVVLPRTLREERQLVFHEVRDLERLVPGPYHIPEPPADAPEVNPADVDLFLVPGAVFDAAGNRIGYGAGYYDSALVQSEGWRVALAYTFQLVPAVPAAEHDMPMDVIATEVGPVDCGQGQLANDHLRMRNMTFYGHHGAFPQEREQGIRLAVDVDLRLDLQVPGLTDNLETTVNYPAVYRLIDRIQRGREFALFEALVEHFATAVLADFPAVQEVTIAARKFHPPVGGLLEAFEVQITRSRPAWLRAPGR